MDTMAASFLEVVVALSSKRREEIIEEETLRYQTRQNLLSQHGAEKKVRWPWILAGAVLVWLAYQWIFCTGVFCKEMGPGCRHHGSMQGEKGWQHPPIPKN